MRTPTPTWNRGRLAVVALLTVLTVPAAPALAGFALPAYETVILENGLTILLLEHHEVPLIDVQVLTAGGALADGDLPGLANLTAEGLRFGTPDLTKDEIDRQVDFVGARLGTWAVKETNGLRASFAVKDTEMMLDLVRDMLLVPTFDDAEFARYQTRYQAELVQMRESPRSVMRDWYDAFLYGDHPYAASASGTVAAVAAASADDLRAYHRDHYRPGNTVLAVVGDFDTGEMRERLEMLFGGWAAGGDGPPDLPAPPVPDRARVLLVNKADARETTFSIGGPGIAENNPDRVAIEVVRTVLGGRFTSWLNDELRVNAGLTYGARAYFVNRRVGGVFRIATYTANETTAEAVDLALKTYDRLWEKGIDEETLASAKAYVKGQLPPDFETSGQLAGLLVNMHFYGYGPEYIDTFEAQVDALTTDRAAEIIDRYFPRENLQFVMIGKAAEIRDLAAKYGEVVEAEITQDGYEF